VKGQEDRRHAGSHSRVYGVEVDRVPGPTSGPALNQLLKPEPDPGHVFQHAGADGDPPSSELIPGQQISREIGEENDEKGGGNQ